MTRHPRPVAALSLALAFFLVLSFPVWATPLGQPWEWIVYLPGMLNEEPIPTPTPTPENTPTPTPTSVPTGVVTAPVSASFVDSLNNLHVLGEVFNHTNSQIKFVKIAANFFDQGGQLVGTDYTFTWLDDLPAHDKTCFLMILPQPTNWASYQFEAPTYSNSTAPRANLAIFGDSGSMNATFGWYELIGQVRNDHGSRVQYVSTVGTLYSAEGYVIGCDFTYVNSTHLEAGQISSFKMTVSGRTYSDVASYRLQVEGNP